MSSTSLLPGPRATAVLLVVAPLLELAESALSPLGDGSSASELGHIASHQGRFTLSVLFGLAAVLLYTPMFLGLANACLAKAPRAARIGGWGAAFSMAGFMGVRGMQAVQLATVEDALDPKTAASLLDHAFANPIGATLLVLFLGGTLVGIIALAIAAWRAGFPRPAVVLLVLFPIIDNAVQGPAGTIAAHAVFLVALGWFATALWTSVSAGQMPAGQANSDNAVATAR